MSKIIVPKVQRSETGFVSIFNKKYSIGNNNWKYESDVVADFDLVYDEDNIFLKFFVQESNVKAVFTEFNQPVYEDSCVEFFISFDRQSYYNLEFNCIGNILGGYGKGRNNREQLCPELLNLIKTKPSLGFNKIEIKERKTDWTLNVVIPKEVFKHENIEKFNGLIANCNFYKCGDKQVYPHYLSWNRIGVENPDFHLPKFFGVIEFK